MPPWKPFQQTQEWSRAKREVFQWEEAVDGKKAGNGFKKIEDMNTLK